MIVPISILKTFISLFNKQKHLSYQILLPLIPDLWNLGTPHTVQFFGSSAILENDYLKIKYLGKPQSNGVKIYQNILVFSLLLMKKKKGYFSVQQLYVTFL